MSEEWRGPEPWIKPLRDAQRRMRHRMSDCLLRAEIRFLLARGRRRQFSAAWPHFIALPCRLALEQWQN